MWYNYLAVGNCVANVILVSTYADRCIAIIAGYSVNLLEIINDLMRWYSESSIQAIVNYECDIVDADCICSKRKNHHIFYTSVDIPYFISNTGTWPFLDYTTFNKIFRRGIYTIVRRVFVSGQ